MFKQLIHTSNVYGCWWTHWHPCIQTKQALLLLPRFFCKYLFFNEPSKSHFRYFNAVIFLRCSFGFLHDKEKLSLHGDSKRSGNILPKNLLIWENLPLIFLQTFIIWSVQSELKTCPNIRFLRLSLRKNKMGTFTFKEYNMYSNKTTRYVQYLNLIPEFDNVCWTDLSCLEGWVSGQESKLQLY